MLVNNFEIEQMLVIWSSPGLSLPGQRTRRPFPDHVLVVDDGDREAGNLVEAALRFEPDFEELQRLLDARMTGEVIGRDRRRCEGGGDDQRNREPNPHAAGA